MNLVCNRFGSMRDDLKKSMIENTVDQELCPWTLRVKFFHKQLHKNVHIMNRAIQVTACEIPAGRRVGDHHDAQCRGL